MKNSLMGTQVPLVLKSGYQVSIIKPEEPLLRRESLSGYLFLLFG